MYKLENEDIEKIISEVRKIYLEEALRILAIRIEYLENLELITNKDKQDEY